MRFISILCIFSFSAILNIHGAQNHQEMEFGEVLGENSGVVAYSNGNESVFSYQFNETGMLWQCVEYARRWLTTVNKLSFPSVENAFEIWKLKEGIDLQNDTRKILKHYENGISTSPPKVGDLIIYNIEFAPVTGHVAVVVDIQDRYVMIAEQNYSAEPWLTKSYSRKLMLSEITKDTQNFFYIHDCPGLIGWVRF